MVKPVPGVDRLESGVRLGCGGLFGLALGGLLALTWLPTTWVGWSAAALAVPLCALLAWRLGDRFWRGVSAVLRPLQQLWPPGR